LVNPSLQQQVGYRDDGITRISLYNRRSVAQMTYQGDFVGLGVAPVPEDDLPGVVVVPVPVVGEGVVVVPVVGEGVVVVGESAGEVVVPVGDSVGEEPPAGVSPPVFGWQADNAVIKPSRSITITFDLTVKSSHSSNFGFYPIFLTAKVAFMLPLHPKERTFWRIFYY
jgi:hypothetical protein